MNVLVKPTFIVMADMEPSDTPGCSLIWKRELQSRVCTAVNSLEHELFWYKTVLEERLLNLKFGYEHHDVFYSELRSVCVSMWHI